MRIIKSVSTVAAVMAMAGLGGAAQSAKANITSGSWIMDQSNTFADGIAYGQVDIVANDVLGTIQFTVDAFNVQPEYGTLSNFGIQSFGFNYQNLTSAPSTWVKSLPSGWTQNDNGGYEDGFGSFTITEDGSGSSRQDPLIFSITIPSAGEAIASNFAVLSTGNAGQGNVYFAAHVAGFSNDLAQSHYIGGSNPIPVPGAVVLAGLGMGLVGLVRRRVA